MLTEFSALLAFKVTRAIALCFAQDAMFFESLSSFTVTFAVLAITATILVPYTYSKGQFSSTAQNTKWPLVLTYSAAHTLSTFLLFRGLAYLSSVRVTLLTEQGELWQLGLIAALKLASKKKSLIERTQWVGIGFSVFSFVLAISMDFTHRTGHSVWERAVGYICVVSSVWLSIFQKNGMALKLSKEAQGMKLLGIASAFGALGLSPIAAFQYFTANNAHRVTPSWSNLALYIGLSLVFVVANQYVNTTGGTFIKTHTRIMFAWGSTVFASLMVSLFFAAPIRFSLEMAVILLYGTGFHYLLKADPSLPFKMGLSSKSHSGILLPTHDGVLMATMDETSGVLSDAGSYIQIILENQDSRQIFYFLLLNLSYMFVQMIYGVWTNSLGLISDAIHMFFDCLALGVGLFASVMSKWPANRTFSYGYSRIETLSGFSNGVFLILISVFIVIEAVERLLHPPEMNTHRLLLVSFVGFVVNLIGIFAFNHGHAHAHGHGHGSCSGSEHGHNANMQGVFLHIMADTLGSVGVIVSTLLIDQFGWTGFDPIASIFIAVLIFMSVVPLIKNSMHILMLQTTHDTVHSLEHLIPQIMHVPGVHSYSQIRFWPNDSESTVGTLHLTVTDGSDEEKIRNEVASLVQRNVSNLKELCIQIEKFNSFNSCMCKMVDVGHVEPGSHSC